MGCCVYCDIDPERTRNRWGVITGDVCAHSPDGEHHESWGDYEPPLGPDPREVAIPAGLGFAERNRLVRGPWD